MESFTTVAKLVSSSASLEKMFSEVGLAISARPTSMSAEEAWRYLITPFETALIRRLDALLQRTQTYPSGPPALDSFRGDVNELRLLRPLLEDDTHVFCFSEDCSGMFELVQSRLA